MSIWTTTDNSEVLWYTTRSMSASAISYTYQPRFIKSLTWHSKLSPSLVENDHLSELEELFEI